MPKSVCPSKLFYARPKRVLFLFCKGKGRSNLDELHHSPAAFAFPKPKTYNRPAASAWGVTQPIRLVYSSEKLVKKPLRSVPRLLV